MEQQNQFIPSQTNIIFDLDNENIHVISNMEELNAWEIVEVKERDFNITVWKCRRKE